jgi:lysozyme
MGGDTPADDLNRLRQHIIANEGWRRDAYADSAGIPTVGVGFNLRRQDAPARIAALGLSYDEVAAGTQRLTDDQIDRLFTADLEATLAGVAALVPGFLALTLARRIALVDMAFNLGLGGLGRFKRLLAAIDRGDWEGAEAEIVDSLYFRQVPGRAKRNARAIRTGALS